MTTTLEELRPLLERMSAFLERHTGKAPSTATANNLQSDIRALLAQPAAPADEHEYSALSAELRANAEALDGDLPQQAATVAIEPKPLDVIGYASPGQIEILRSLPRTGGMKLKGRKGDRYSEPVVLLSDARAAMISLAARCQQEGAFKVCLECGYQDGHDEICQFHATNRKPSTVTRDQIRDVFMRNGFTVKEGQTDLKPYVYAAAEELLSIALAARTGQKVEP